MASLIKSPLLDETGKAILAALQGEEPEEQSGSKIKAPMSDETGKAILEFLQNGGGGGSGGGAFVVNVSEHPTLGISTDKTMKEIKDAAETQVILLRYESETAETSQSVPATLVIDGDICHLYYAYQAFGGAGQIYNTYSDNETHWAVPD